MKKFIPNWKFLYGYTEQYLSAMAQKGYRYKQRKGFYVYLEPCKPHKAAFFLWFASDVRPIVGCGDIALPVHRFYGLKKKDVGIGVDPIVTILNPDKIDKDFDRYVNERNKRCIYYALFKLMICMLGWLFPLLALLIYRKITILFFVFLLITLICSVNVALNVRQYIKHKNQG